MPLTNKLAPSTVSAHTSTALLLSTFLVRGTLFGFDAQIVQEVIRVGTVTPVPHAPAEVLGVINLRGKIVTLLDTGLLLGFPPGSPDTQNRIFVIEDKGEFFGMLVDRVDEVVELDPGQLEPPPANMPQAQAMFCAAVCRVSGRVITLLKTKELLSATRSPAGNPALSDMSTRR